MLENEIINGEQPNDQVVHAMEMGNEGTNDQEGSPLGKFKDAQKLLGAYNELQSEFTRKCQKLSEVQKQLEEQNQSQKGTEEVVNGSKDKEFAWSNKLENFLQIHKNASGLVEDITNEIINDNDLKDSEDALEKAYMRVMEKNYEPQENLAKNEEFLNKYIYSNNEIKDKIIKEYVSSLQDIKSPIQVTSMGQIGSIASTPKFTNLTDANKFVENMFKF